MYFLKKNTTRYGDLGSNVQECSVIEIAQCMQLLIIEESKIAIKQAL